MGLSRSEQMARIKGKHTSPELRLRSALWRAGIRYRVHARTPVGRPDIVLPSRKLAIFIDGCFWHGCPKHYVRPRTRKEFWEEKLLANISRDRQQTLQLETLGWRVIRVWEHKVFESLDDVVFYIKNVLPGNGTESTDEWRVERVDVVDAGLDIERRVMVDLRNPEKRYSIDSRRITAKWKLPANVGSVGRKSRKQKKLTRALGC
ncbi:very short patch repair endonuclease [Pyxidicoccus trucidator]|uniref:very short patch repair endonuclease n=1 Tax=Pyxidicoccus trucidator TaxID=2709662 RepID=UPI0013D90FCC|nr:very short patch repair endonuclease [Pyxidicoccus trucidator]